MTSFFKEGKKKVHFSDDEKDKKDRAITDKGEINLNFSSFLF